jgi:uncharacterized OB-fold protein
MRPLPRCVRCGAILYPPDQECGYCVAEFVEAPITPTVDDGTQG